MTICSCNSQTKITHFFPLLNVFMIFLISRKLGLFKGSSSQQEVISMHKSYKVDTGAIRGRNGSFSFALTRSIISENKWHNYTDHICCTV